MSAVSAAAVERDADQVYFSASLSSNFLAFPGNSLQPFALLPALLDVHASKKKWNRLGEVGEKKANFVNFLICIFYDFPKTITFVSLRAFHRHIYYFLRNLCHFLTINLSF